MSTERITYHTELLTNRLKKRWKHLWKWARRNGVSCFRVYDRDIPEIPISVDVYDRYLHVNEYPGPKELEAPDAVEWSEAIRDTAARVLTIAPERVFWKRREPQKGSIQYEKVDTSGRRVPVAEGGYTFLVNLSDYVDTGLFLDHRVTRGIVGSLCSGKRFLNLFSYTGSFTVYAAGGGARSTVSVDTSNTYNEWAAENLRVNGLFAPFHRFEREDVGRFLERESRSAAGRYDVIVMDPPTFSNSKKMEGTLDIQRDHPALLRTACRLLAPSGILFFSTNLRSFKWAADLNDPFSAREITADTVPEDFLGRRPHRAWLIQRHA
ncbi:MAG: SAM-dependent methyltransferase [Spirochaetaceae bacterium]|nr:MAG: SAM-dependent methyltransferase [Spirochaetaceae bacterium]